MKLIDKPEIQDKVYDFIRQYKKEHNGYSPSIREICDACDISATSYASWILDKLDAQGRIVVGEGARNIRIPGEEYVLPEPIAG